MADNLAKRLMIKILLVTGIPQLRQVEASCQQIIDNIDTPFKQMSRAYTCTHSKVPEGRTFCDYFKKCCISYCGRCEHFENRYLKQQS